MTDTDLPNTADPMFKRSARDPQTTVDHYQVFGERRSGTNFIEKLIDENFALNKVQQYGWKHGFPSMYAISSNALIVAVVRDPIDWLVSFFSTPFSVHKSVKRDSFSAFIRSEWDSVARQPVRHWVENGYAEIKGLRGEVMQLDRHPIEGRPFRNVLEMRSVKMAAHLGLVRRATNAVAVSYEDVAADPEAFVRTLSALLDLRRNAPVNMLSERVGPPGNDRALTRSDIGAEDLAFIASELDQGLEQSMGYLRRN